jgi:anaerobic selenocysteine-containing dehydrogenase
MKGERHERMIGRPVAMHAMRGISAHSNGFQTCRALHMLQILLGSIDCPGGFRFKPPYPRPVAGQPSPHGGACQTRRLPARRWAIRAGRKTCWSKPTARRRSASTRPFHGMRRCPPMA